MSKVRDYSKLAQDIIDIIGTDKIANVTRCATRLRLVLTEIPEDAKEKISQLPGVISVVINNGQFQIVIGTHVGDVYDAVMQLVDIDADSGVEEPKGSILNRIIATMSAVFAPFIYILAAAGILQGVLILINLAFPAFATTDTYRVFSFISWAPFTFLPIFIAITASKHFKVNMYIAVACAMALVSPDWATMAAEIAGGQSLTFMGIPLSETTYTSSVLPPLILVWLLSYLEKGIEKILPAVVKPLFTPLLCLVIMVPLTILILGPASSMTATAIANGYNFLVSVAPALAGAIIGGFWQVVVIFGVHWGITPMVLANYEMYGRDSFQAFQTIAVVAQVGAVLGVFLKAKSKELKNVSLSAFITGIFGITEPAIYGVTLRFKKPFIFGCISGAIGAIVASFFQPYYFAYAGLPGVLTIVNGIDSSVPTSFIGIAIGCGIAIVGPVVLTQIFGFGETIEEDVKMSQEIEQDTTVPNTLISHLVCAPLKGEVISLKDVPDEVFASGAMGNGIAIKPTDNKVYAPFDGVVTSLFASKHAIGLTSDEGVEVLIHVGLDTVNLEGKPFNCLIEQDQTVKKGDVLMEIDLAAIEEAGYSTITPIIITNTATYESVAEEQLGSVSFGDAVLKIN
ncbi:beta-glucoside-specific PTS transporter subunit IIABC [Enterococcus sp. AZ109]|uniref:beta-glucoside-specific PTS transporter subunit IIABC n=1 Tax=Enterococcus sp. AZ109 TaxID=2774634 RepID=UPI003F208090